MAIIDVQLPPYLAKTLNLPLADVKRQQLKVLKKLLNKARFTRFGQAHNFDEVLLSKNVAKAYQQNVPVFDYNTLYNTWWHQALEGKKDVCWPGMIKYFALSSGTSEAASKYIPVTKDLIKSNTATSFKQLLSLTKYENLPAQSIGKSWLIIGGSTELQKGETYYAGDLSGIQQKNIPFWFRSLGLYKPGAKIAKVKDWSAKIDEVVENAPKWDIGFIVGVPAWLQICLERIIERYNLNTIHDLWPNLSFFVHGGVSLEPYKSSFNKLVSKPLIYIETYLASEGFIAYQNRPGTRGMHLAINDNIFFEFIPFNEDNFDAEGNLLPNPETLMLHEIQEDVDYAILISTNAGAWRYLLGDTVKLINKERSEILITGRTKHFLSLVGEHLSVENMNMALSKTAVSFGVDIPEYAVAGVKNGNLFGHEWYVATNSTIDEVEFAKVLDDNIKAINDDYITERNHALKSITVFAYPEKTFLDFMQSKGKFGGQHKFPRVLKGSMLADWKQFLMQNSLK